MTTLNPNAILSELRLLHPTLDLYLVGARLQINDDQIEIHVLTPWARAWLDARLRPTIETALRQLTGRELQIVFHCEAKL